MHACVSFRQLICMWYQTWSRTTAQIRPNTVQYSHTWCDEQARKRSKIFFSFLFFFFLHIFVDPEIFERKINAINFWQLLWYCWDAELIAQRSMKNGTHDLVRIVLKKQCFYYREYDIVGLREHPKWLSLLNL